MAGYIGANTSSVTNNQNAAERRKKFTFTANTTVLSGLSFLPNNIHIFNNGIRLVKTTDYTEAADGQSVTLVNAAQAGDEIVAVTFDQNPATGGSSYTDADVDAHLLTAGVTLDTTNNRVGINESTPTGSLHVKGTSTAHGKIILEAGGSGGSANNNYIEFNKHDGTKLAEVAVEESVSNGGDVIFKTTPSGGAATSRWRITHDGNFKAETDGLGIDFSAAQTSSGVTIGDSLLDDYEQGTFNLTMVGYHGSPTTTQLIPCHYTKVGNTVHFWGYKTGVNNTGASAHMWFSGLPFTANSPYSVGNLYFDGVAQLPTSPFAWIAGTIVYAYRHVNNGTAVSVYHNVVTSGSVQIQGTFRV